MILKISRSWDGSPLTPYKKVLDKYYAEYINNHAFIKLETIKDLLVLQTLLEECKGYTLKPSLIISEGEIMIYDDYME